MAKIDKAQFALAVSGFIEAQTDQWYGIISGIWKGDEPEFRGFGGGSPTLHEPWEEAYWTQVFFLNLLEVLRQWDEHMDWEVHHESTNVDPMTWRP